MKLNAFILFFGIILIPFNTFSQKEINQTDSQGKRDGVWEKYYEGTQQLRYEGKFDHGKEVGEFKFYCEECKDKPTVIKKYNHKDDIAEVEYFTIKGKLVSEGKMKGHDRVGEWITYHKDSKTPMVRETYSNGKLTGRRTTYYPDGSITEELDFSNGLKDGENIYYSVSGVVIKKLQYKDDMLHGPASYYDGYGILLIEGSYKNDRKDGLWKYYKNGKVVLEETFPKKDRD